MRNTAGKGARNSISMTITARGPNELVVETDADGAAYLVVLDGFAPAWSAEVDGTAARVWRAFGAYRCVVVGAGKHTVRFRY